MEAARAKKKTKRRKLIWCMPIGRLFCAFQMTMFVLGLVSMCRIAKYVETKNHMKIEWQEDVRCPFDWRATGLHRANKRWDRLMKSNETLWKRWFSSFRNKIHKLWYQIGCLPGTGSAHRITHTVRGIVCQHYLPTTTTKVAFNLNSLLILFFFLLSSQLRSSRSVSQIKIV